MWALARVRQAEGRALSAEGAFDTVFSAEGGSRVIGYYDGSYADAKVTRPLDLVLAEVVEKGVTNGELDLSPIINIALIFEYTFTPRR